MNDLVFVDAAKSREDLRGKEHDKVDGKNGDAELRDRRSNANL